MYIVRTYLNEIISFHIRRRNKQQRRLTILFWVFFVVVVKAIKAVKEYFTIVFV